MTFLPYEDVPLYLARLGDDGEYIFAESASISVQQPLRLNRQLDDNIFPISAYGIGDSIEYVAEEFTANNPVTVLLGPKNGPPQPLSTAYSKIPQHTEITFPNGKHLYFNDDVYPNGHNYLVSVYSKSSDWSLSEEEAQLGYFEGEYKYNALGPVIGSLSVNFYINQGNLQSFFNVGKTLNPNLYPPIDEERITGFLGNFCFSHAYLKDLSFSLSPNSLSQASANFDIYGELNYSSTVTDNYYTTDLYRQQSIPHADNSRFVGLTDLGINHPVSFSYNISVDRSAKFEAPTDSNINQASLTPSRVTKNKTSIKMAIEGDNINPNILRDGFNGKRANVKVELHDLEYDSFGSNVDFTENNTNGILNSFSCNGVIDNHDLSVNSNGHLRGSVSVIEDKN